MPKNRKPTTDALEILDRLLYEGRPERRRPPAEVEANDEIGRKIRALRTGAGLTPAAVWQTHYERDEGLRVRRNG
jgi:hypothetical protein